MREEPALGWLSVWSQLCPRPLPHSELFLAGPWVPPQDVVRRPGISASRHSWERYLQKEHSSLGSAGPRAGTGRSWYGGRSHTYAGRGSPGQGMGSGQGKRQAHLVWALKVTHPKTPRAAGHPTLELQTPNHLLWEGAGGRGRCSRAHPPFPSTPQPLARGCFLSNLGGGDAGRLCSQVLLTPHKGNTLTK